MTDMNEAIRRRLAGRTSPDRAVLDRAADRAVADPGPGPSTPVVPGGVRSTAATDRPAVTLGDVIRGHLAAEAERRGGHVRTAHADRTARHHDEDET